MLQQIIFYRELDVSIEEIKNIVQQPGFDQVTALENHSEKYKKKNVHTSTKL